MDGITIGIILVIILAAFGIAYAIWKATSKEELELKPSYYRDTIEPGTTWPAPAKYSEPTHGRYSKPTPAPQVIERTTVVERGGGSGDLALGMIIGGALSSTPRHHEVVEHRTVIDHRPAHEDPPQLDDHDEHSTLDSSLFDTRSGDDSYSRSDDTSYATGGDTDSGYSSGGDSYSGGGDSGGSDYSSGGDSYSGGGSDDNSY